jgi:hypothetical protein
LSDVDFYPSQNWTDGNNLGMHAPLQAFAPAGMAGNMPLSNGAFRVDPTMASGGPDYRMNLPSQPGEEQLIPTAIVIKNIPFAVRKEALAAMMLEMHLPVPYAFNYHFDGGVFRGLAFANFQSPEDTRIVIDAMNGMEVHGRKLRVEYKKMLPADERERIEREKRERRGQLEEQHRAPPMLGHQPSLQSLTGSNSAANQPLMRKARLVPSNPGLADHLPVGDVDLNDQQTLNFFTELLLFSKDPTREILVFPSTITPEQRRQIHILAHNMGLQHRSSGEADSRQLHVLKTQVASPTTQTHNLPSVSLDMHKRGLSRAATFDFAADRESRNPAANYSHALGRHGPMLELPGSPDGSGIPSNLRAAKSFADLRTLTPSPSHSTSSYLNLANGMSSLANSSAAATARFGDYGGFGQQSSGNTPNLTPNTPGQGQGNGDLLSSGLSGLALGPFEPAAPQLRSTPGAIGSQRPGAGGSGSRNAPERQPRGPEWENSGGFGGRGRIHGHAQRGSGKPCHDRFFGTLTDATAA